MMPELLAPAGSAECLETALYFGADAVYVGLGRFGMRAFAENFTPEELSEAVTKTHAAGRRLHVALNALIRPEEMKTLRETLGLLREIGPDAVIFSDPAVLMCARELAVHIPLHLSTQASAANGETCRFWAQNGVERIILARELTLEEIRAVRRAVGPELELETFVHGAMCVAYSGRCLLSSVLTGRSGNQGRCAQPCRWEYELSEVGSSGQRFSIREEQEGTYILNANDLMMLEYLPQLQEAGISSFKIEGRNKSVFYVASAVHAYRQALDAQKNGPAPEVIARLKNELEGCSSRQYDTGFYFGRKKRHQDPLRTELPRRYTFVGKVLGCENNVLTVEQRNHFKTGERLEVLSPYYPQAAFVVEELSTMEGERVETAPHPQQHLRMRCGLKLHPGDLLRRRDEI